MLNSITIQNVIRSYQLLASQNQNQKNQANDFLYTLVDQQQSWQIANKMITQVTDPQYRFLGAQIIYQKIERQLTNLDQNAITRLKQFLFSQINNNNDKAIVDKLASGLALLLVLTIEKQQSNIWIHILTNLIQFMKVKTQNLYKGLIIIERLAQQLHINNRIMMKTKNYVKEQLISQNSQDLLKQIYFDVFIYGDKSKDDKLLITNLTCLESFVKIGFSLLTYSQLCRMILEVSIRSQQHLQSSSKVLCSVLKITSTNKFKVLNQMDPNIQKQSYSSQQIKSLKYVIEYIFKHSNNFLPQSKKSSIDGEYVEMFIEIIINMLLGYGFLLLQDVGYELLELMLKAMNSIDLKLSYKTFNFWINFSEKIIRIKSLQKKNNVYDQIFLKIKDYYIRVFQSLMQKNLLDVAHLQQLELKDDDTIDDSTSLSFKQYRQQSSSLAKYLYEYFHREQSLSDFYFQQIFRMFRNELNWGWQGVELGIFLIKAAIQSIVDEKSTFNLAKSVQLIIKMNSQQMPQRIVSQSLNLIRDCTRQIKTQKYIFVQCLKFVLKYLNEEKFSNYSAYCFQVLMETIQVIDDEYIVVQLLNYYASTKLNASQYVNRSLISQKMLEGLFNAIVKFAYKQKIAGFLESLIKIIIQVYEMKNKQFYEINKITENSQQPVKLDFQPWVQVLVEIKTILDCYDISDANFKKQHSQLFKNLSISTLKLINDILHFSLICKQPPKYTLLSQLGLSVSAYKVIIKIYGSQCLEQQLVILDTVLKILDNNHIKQLCVLISMISETLLSFNTPNIYFQQWLKQSFSQIFYFYCQYFEYNSKKRQQTTKLNLKNNTIDPDVMKYYYGLLEHIIIYNPSGLLYSQLNKQGNSININMGLYCLRWVNEKTMQRKISNFLFLYIKAISNNQSYQKILQDTFLSLPHLNAMILGTLGKIYEKIMLYSDINQKQEIFQRLFIHLVYNYHNEYPTNVSSINLSQQQKNNLKIICQLLAFAVQSGQERYLKMGLNHVKDIMGSDSISINGFTNQGQFIKQDLLIQMQMQYMSWKRQMKNMPIVK